VYACVRAYVQVCIYVYVCMIVCMYLCMYLRMYECMYVGRHICTYINRYKQVVIRISLHTHEWTLDREVTLYTRIQWVRGSNFSKDTDYHVSGVSPASQGKCHDTASNNLEAKNEWNSTSTFPHAPPHDMYKNIFTFTGTCKLEVYLYLLCSLCFVYVYLFLFIFSGLV
jgi:hypothetical protein